ncbi:MAG: apolipoprotein N-acyltransferase [Victivallales bacterium]|nr:apolipoprotein N-acyltransferase [Victivallales bacterium]
MTEQGLMQERPSPVPGHLVDFLRGTPSSRPGNEAWVVSRRKKILRFIALACSGMLYSSIFPPLNFSHLAWVAVIPFFLIVRRRPARRAFADGMLWGYFWALTSFAWLREIESFIPFGMAFVLCLFPACWAGLVPVFCRRMLPVPSEDMRPPKAALWMRQTAFVVVCSALWCLLDWTRSWIFTGLPWNFISASQWKNIPLIQICEFTGVYGLSFMLIYFNLALSFAGEGLCKSLHTSARFQRPLPLIIGIAALMGCVFIGARSLVSFNLPAQTRQGGTGAGVTTLRAAVVQGDIEQMRIPQPGDAEFALEQYVSFSQLAASSAPDILIWPETAVPIPFFSGCAFGQYYRFKVSQMQRENGVSMLIGSVDFAKNITCDNAPEGVPMYNAALHLDRNTKLLDYYYKQHLVPFGEYTPLGRFYPWVKQKFGMGRDLSRGNRYTLFDLKPGVRAAALICYEDIFPYLSREFALRGANLIIVLTNDAWYPESSEPEQHLVNSVFRAVETRRPVIRAGNNNGTCLILPSGLIADSISGMVEAEGKFMPTPEVSCRGFSEFEVGVLDNPPLTFYTRFGDVFILFCALVFLVAVLDTLSAWHREKIHSLKSFAPSGSVDL